MLATRGRCARSSGECAHGHWRWRRHGRCLRHLELVVASNERLARGGKHGGEVIRWQSVGVRAAASIFHKVV